MAIRSIDDMALPSADAVVVIAVSTVAITSWFGQLMRDDVGETGWVVRVEARRC